jgi:hypothetical protein
VGTEGESGVSSRSDGFGHDFPTETPSPHAIRADVPDSVPPTLRSWVGPPAPKSDPPPKNAGRKDDQAKLRLDLVPWRALESMAAVLTHGAAKYGDDNWHRVLSPNRRYFAAALRHLGAWRLGQRNDPDTDLPHLAHAGCCVLFLLSKLLGFDPPLDGEGE